MPLFFPITVAPTYLLDVSYKPLLLTLTTNANVLLSDLASPCLLCPAPCPSDATYDSLDLMTTTVKEKKEKKKERQSDWKRSWSEKEDLCVAEALSVYIYFANLFLENMMHFVICTLILSLINYFSIILSLTIIIAF